VTPVISHRPAGAWLVPVAHVLLGAAVLFAAAPRAARGQSYYNLDAGRPGRVEDASPTPRYELELQPLPLRFEQYASGARRWRSDTKISFGVSPFTEIEVRAPFLVVDPRAGGAPVTNGFGGFAIGALHELTLETGAIPALAVAGEIALPVGNLAAPVGSYSTKVIGTKTFHLARIHANVGYGTWSVRASPSNIIPCPRILLPGEAPPPGCGKGQPSVPDTPCDRAPTGAQFACIASNAPSIGQLSSPTEVSTPSTVGSRWMAGVGVDHAFALSSTLISADAVAERLLGLYDAIDWSAELGLRHQWTPQVVLDVGVGRHFSGVVRSNSIVLGLTYALPLQSFRSASRGE
jgi:hypothetical protein